MENFSFSLHKGEIIAIVGPSGCGKSTILNKIGNLIPKSSGKIEFNEDKTGIVLSTTVTDPEIALENVLDIDSAASVLILQEIACDRDVDQSSFFMSIDCSKNTVVGKLISQIVRQDDKHKRDGRFEKARCRSKRKLCIFHTQAVDQRVKDVAGGVYLRTVKIENLVKTGI